MSKTLEDLQKSRLQRQQILKEFGVIPQSIIKHDKSKKAIDFLARKRTYYSTTNIKGHVGKLAEIFDVSGQSVRSGALSRFSQNVGAVILKLYSKQNDIVIDPFAGHNSRMELVVRHNRHYKGQDVSAEFIEANYKIAEILLEEKRTDLFQDIFKATIELKCGDSRNLQFPNECGDFILTSPPYWNIEYYGNELEQLGNGTYKNFLDGLLLVMRESYRCLKHNSYAAIFVADFRKNGIFYNFHGDTIELMQVAGFIQKDIIIVDLGEPIRAAFAQQIIDTKIIPKRHEYCLIFYKSLL